MAQTRDALVPKVALLVEPRMLRDSLERALAGRALVVDAAADGDLVVMGGPPVAGVGEPEVVVRAWDPTSPRSTDDLPTVVALVRSLDDLVAQIDGWSAVRRIG